MDHEDGQSRRQITDISVATSSPAGGALTPIFARDGVSETMELRSEALEDHLVRKCDRVLAAHKLTVFDVLRGAVVDL